MERRVDDAKISLSVEKRKLIHRQQILVENIIADKAEEASLLSRLNRQDRDRFQVSDRVDLDRKSVV